MNITTFDHGEWETETFDTIGYSKDTKILHIYFFTGHVIQYTDVPENVIFDFVLAGNKEAFYLENIKSRFASKVFRLIS